MPTNEMKERGHGVHAGNDDLIQPVLAYLRRRIRRGSAQLGGVGDPAQLAAALKGTIGAAPKNPETVLRLYRTVLEPAAIACDHPGFLGFVPAAPTAAATLFDMVVSASALHGTSWLESSGAVAAENQVLRLLADLAGLPDTAGGCFVGGGSAGNLSALAVARDTMRQRRGLPERAPVRVAVGDEAHPSIKNALHLLGVDALPVPTQDHRLTENCLRTTLERDGRDGAPVIAVVATAGSSSAGLIDDLPGVAAQAQERGLWLHIDAAYGGAALFVPEMGPRLRGIQAADSLVIDPHKWLFTPFACGALLYREPQLARAVHAQRASVLDALHLTDPDETWNPCDYATHLTRRPCGLPLWFSLAVNGTTAYRDAVACGMALARHAAGLVKHAEHLDLLLEPELTVVLIRRRGWQATDYHAWARRLLADGTAFVTPVAWNGETVARLAFLNPHTDKETIDSIIESLNDYGEKPRSDQATHDHAE